MRKLCEYEANVLTRVAAKDVPDDPGAAWWAALEALVESGYLAKGELTQSGRDALAQLEKENRVDEKYETTKVAAELSYNRPQTQAILAATLEQAEGDTSEAAGQLVADAALAFMGLAATLRVGADDVSALMRKANPLAAEFAARLHAEGDA